MQAHSGASLDLRVSASIRLTSEATAAYFVRSGSVTVSAAPSRASSSSAYAVSSASLIWSITCRWHVAPAFIHINVFQVNIGTSLDCFNDSSITVVIR